MLIEKKVLGEIIKALGKVVCCNSPDEVLRQVRFVDGWALATDGVEVVMVRCVEADEVDFCLKYKALRELVRSCKGG